MNLTLSGSFLIPTETHLCVKLLLSFLPAASPFSLSSFLSDLSPLFLLSFHWMVSTLCPRAACSPVESGQAFRVTCRTSMHAGRCLHSQHRMLCTQWPVDTVPPVGLDIRRDTRAMHRAERDAEPLESSQLGPGSLWHEVHIPWDSTEEELPHPNHSPPPPAHTLHNRQIASHLPLSLLLQLVRVEGGL